MERMPRLTGRWPFKGFPNQISLLGRTFIRAVWEQDYPYVIAQYREISPRRSYHLMVHQDLTWEINHADTFNPDTGLWGLIGHAIFDVLHAGIAGDH